MPDTLGIHLALRGRALTAVVCTTGTMTLAATATGFTRAAGSFLTDGFVPGQELAPAGFADNTRLTVADVAALTLTTREGRSAEVAAAGRRLTVGPPAARAWENEDFTPPADGRGYLAESFVPATSQLRTIPRVGGLRELTGLYILRLFGPANAGAAALRRLADAIDAVLTPGTPLTLGNGDVVYVRGDVGPSTSQILPGAAGWAFLPLTVPWRLDTVNS